MCSAWCWKYFHVYWKHEHNFFLVDTLLLICPFYSQFGLLMGKQMSSGKFESAFLTVVINIGRQQSLFVQFSHKILHYLYAQ